MQDETAVTAHNITVTITRSAGADNAPLVMVDTTEEIDSDDGPLMRILLNDEPVWNGVAYVAGSVTTTNERRIRALAQLSMIQTLAGTLADAARDVAAENKDENAPIGTPEHDVLDAIALAADTAREACSLAADRLILDLSAA